MADEEITQKIIPVLQEELKTSKRIVKTGSVRVNKRVDYRTEIVSMPLMRHTVDVKRVPVNKEIETMPEIRTVGATTIIPVVEEEIVVTRRLILKEEVHMTKRHSSEVGSKQVEVGTERAEIERLDAEGRVIETDAKPDSKRHIIHRRSV